MGLKRLLRHDVKCRLFRLFFLLAASGWIMLQRKFYFCGWSWVERSWSWPVSRILIISCHFCFLLDLSLMRCSLSIFFRFGSRITAFIWWLCTGKNSLHSSRVQECMLIKLFYSCYLSVQWFSITFNFVSADSAKQLAAITSSHLQ